MSDARKRELIEALLRQRGVDPASLPIAPRPADAGPAPLSFAQERLWILERFAPGRPTYNEAYEVRLAGRLDPAVLGATLRELSRRHAALRTTFEARGGTAVQRIGEPGLSMPVVDLSALPVGLRSAEAGRRAREEAEHPFDLERGPVVRATLLRLGREEHHLLLVLHHIISDATSIEILVSELVEIQHVFARGDASPLPEPRLQYADFAQWQREKLASSLEAQLADWKERLAGAPTVLTLPSDRPRSEQPLGRGASMSAVLPAVLSGAVRELARTQGATLFMTLLSAFDALLYRYTGRQDLLVGTPIAGRTRAEVEGLVGFFVNTLVLRADLAGDPAFSEMLARNRRSVLAAYDRQDVPFGRLVEELRPERSASHAPLVQVMFLLQKPGVPIEDRNGLSLEMRRVETGTAKFDLTFLARDASDGIVCGVEYDADLFLPTTMARLLAHFRTILEAVTADPGTRLSQLPVLTAPERQQVLVEWNDAALARPRGACIHELFAARAAASPDAPALIFEGRTTSYGELNAQANRLARRLRALGLRVDDLVGLCLEPSPDLMVAVLGILKAGGAYVPLDPGHPAERLAWLLEDTGLRIVLTDSSVADRLPDTRARVVRLDEERDLLAALSPEEPEPWSLPESLAYQIYTSGSTGRPKGVMVPHAGLVNLALSFVENWRLGPGDRMLMLHSMAFDASVGDLFPPLVSGAALVLHRNPQALLGRDLNLYLEQQGITCIELAAAFWQQWTEDLAARGQTPPSTLRTLVVGGESVTPDRIRTWYRLLSGRPFRLLNHYGPTEITVCASSFWIDEGGEGFEYPRLPIGRPLPNVRLYLLDQDLQAVPAGVPGELCIGGVGVARGYLNRPDVTAERFIPDFFVQPEEEGTRLYRTGDLARHLADGNLEFLGRVDHQVKIRGYRIEPGEIEAALAGHPALRETAVVARSDEPGPKRLVAYVVAGSEPAPDAAELRAFLKGKLPAHMVPEAFVVLDRLPINANGKVDRKALPRPVFERSGPGAGEAPPLPETGLQRRIAEVWRELLRLETVDVHDNFFELGGHSLLLIRMEGRLRDVLDRDVQVIDLFRHPTIASLADFLGGGAGPEAEPGRPRTAAEGREIAVVGMAGRFPGAGSVDELWRNLRAGIESIAVLSDEELLAAGIPPEQLSDGSYVRAQGALRDVDRFDAPFFGYSPREAEVLDPQHRHFLQCAWEALESAGYDPESYPGAIGVFAGVGRNSYLMNNLLPNEDRLRAAGVAMAMLGNDKDFVPTRASYKLNLRGPSVVVQSACSTSLTAVHLACRSLLDGESDMALAGGASIPVPHRVGYVYDEGGIFSPDGHCRAFDAEARGTVPGSGVALVVLKRLHDALADGDFIHAVIKGSAINNDGSLKVGYTAPSPEGQARVLREALERAGVAAGSISYIETHGTGTALGDVIEIGALKEVFGGQAGPERCALGSLKSNVGHMDTAAGAGGLIKAALALRHGEIPPSLHFRTPNPKLGLEGSPFFVNDRLAPWPRNGEPRRAGVSSFGIGGTNAHAVLEEAPAAEPGGESRPWQLLTLSARTGGAVARAAERLASHLEERPEIDLADAAFTLHLGRRAFGHRVSVVCRDGEEAVAALRRLPPIREAAASPEVVFLFPGSGAQHVHMGRDLYASEAVFREAIDRAAGLLAPDLDGVDLRGLLYPEEGEAAAAAATLERTSFAMPAVFAVSYALARLWMSWGILPTAMAGHSLGEYVAACLAEVLSFEDALHLVALRGRLLESLPEGSTLSVPLSEAEVEPLLGPELSIAAVNAPAVTVVSGPAAAVRELERTLAAHGVEARRVQIAAAMHSKLVEPILGEFRRGVEAVTLRPPQRPYVSTVTGAWITAAEATDPGYWTAHLRRTVRFADALSELLREPGRVVVEVGPGRTLASLTRQQVTPGQAGRVFASLPHPGERRSDLAAALETLGALWCCGARPDWQAFHAAERRRRVPLPTYPFEDLRYWIEPGRDGARDSGRVDFADRFWVHAWKRSPVPPGPPEPDGSWVAVDLRGLSGASLERALAGLGPCGARVGLITAGQVDLQEGKAGPAAALRLRGIDARTVDVDGTGAVQERLVAEVAATSGAPDVAYRGGRRWVLAPERVRLEADLRGRSRLAEGGACVVTGASSLAGSLARIDGVLRVETGPPSGSSATPADTGWFLLVSTLSGDPVEKELAVSRLAAAADVAATPWFELALDDLDGAPLPEPAELSEALRRVLALEPGSRVTMSAGDLPARLAGATAKAPAVDDPRLAEGRHPRPLLEQPYEPPADGLELDLARIWQDLLGIEPVGRHDGYFELGGDSLIAIRLLSRVRQELRLDVSLETFLGAPTLAGLAAASSAGRTAGEEAAIPRARRDGPLPLSYIQEDTWHNLRRPDGVLQHNASAAYRGRGPLHREALERSLNEIARRHEVLRTTFPEVDGRPVQRIAPSIELTVPLIDLGGLPEHRRETEAQRIGVEAYWEKFPLETGPFLRLMAVRFGEDDHGLLRAIGRLVTDGGSLRVLLDELMAFYDAFLHGRRPELPEPPIQYADFAVWQRRSMESEAMRGHLDYWTEKMRGAPDRLCLRTDFPYPAVLTYRGTREGVPVEAFTTEALKALGRSEGATLFMVLLALYGALLHRNSGEEDFVVATPMSHRVPETEQVMGRFLNTLALRFDLSGDPSFGEILRRVRGICLEAYAHKDLPHERLLEEIRPVQEGGFRPLCQVSFVLQEIALPDLRMGRTEMRPFWVDHGGSDFELTLGFSQDETGALDGFLEYTTDLFTSATARAMAEHFRILAAAVVENPRLRLSDLMRRTGGNALVRATIPISQLVHEGDAHVRTHAGG